MHKIETKWTNLQISPHEVKNDSQSPLERRNIIPKTDISTHVPTIPIKDYTSTIPIRPHRQWVVESWNSIMTWSEQKSVNNYRFRYLSESVNVVVIRNIIQITNTYIIWRCRYVSFSVYIFEMRYKYMNNLENNMRIICIIFTKYDIIICIQLSYRRTAYTVWPT